ncbi:MoaB/Mog domain-containing protein [Suillus occidentalis]|nr:MoaB/Mog domain-containing protein [Suillus occidentalis]
MVEDTELLSTTKDANGQDAEEKEVKTLMQVPPNDNIREPGSDVHKGDLVLHRGEVLISLGGEVGTLTFVGQIEVKVHRKPVIAILSTRNELLDLQSPNPLPSDGWGGIWDTNRPSLQAALEGMGYNVVDLGIVADDINAHVKAIKQGLESADLLLTTGRTSMGASDLLKPVVECQFGGTTHFGWVSMKPRQQLCIYKICM